MWNVLMSCYVSITYDDRHWLLAVPATGSVMPVLFYDVVDNRRLREGVEVCDATAWPSSFDKRLVCSGGIISFFLQIG